jgi:hypothetical protein
MAASRDTHVAGDPHPKSSESASAAACVSCVCNGICFVIGIGFKAVKYVAFMVSHVALLALASLPIIGESECSQILSSDHTMYEHAASSGGNTTFIHTTSWA